MKVLIIEDERIAADRLIRFLLELDDSIEIVASLDSVRSSVAWISESERPDLAFLDIQLADGKSFEILEKVKTQFPIIFTTAYDQYAIDAFKVNVVDYLLKPIVMDDLAVALQKAKSRKPTNLDSQALINLFQQQSKKYKERFVVKVGNHLKSVMTSESNVIYSQDKASWVLTKSHKIFLLDYTLDQLEDMLSPQTFFRISRKYLVNIESIQDIIAFSNSRMKLKIHGLDVEDVIVARERISEFKGWLDR